MKLIAKKQRDIQKLTIKIGELAFDLHDTYGFPYELTGELAAELNLSINWPTLKAVFMSLYQKQQDRSRKASSMGKDVFVDSSLKLKVKSTKFEGYENMAETAALCKFFGDRLAYLHLNDNWRLWDDDMMVGSVHTIELLELLYWLEKIDFEGWYSLDIFPYRDDEVGLATESFNWIKDLRRVMYHIGMDNIQ